MKFVKIDHLWYRFDESTTIEHAKVWSFQGTSSGYMDLTDHEFVEADDFYSLDWSDTKLLSNQFLTGWLDKYGDFYGCHYRYHREQALYVHKKLEEQLEKEGFIKISYEPQTRTQLIARVPSINGKYNEISRYQYSFLKNYPIVNFDDIEYIYRTQLRKRVEANAPGNSEPENA